MQINPDNAAVVVVDMQNDFCHPDGALYSRASEEAIEPINDVLERAGETGVPVVFTQDTHVREQFEDAHYYDEFDQWGEHCRAGSWGWALHSDLYATGGEWAVSKPTYDAFHETSMAKRLHERGIQDLIIVGTLANVCVLHTAASAALHDFRPIVLRNCVGYIEEEQRDNALEHIDFLCGEVMHSSEVEFNE